VSADRPSRIVFVAANPSIDRLLEVGSIEPGAIHRPDRVVVVPGGKGLNAARAAKALGGSVVAVAVLGGHAGTWIAERLAELGVATRTIDVESETRTCVSILDRSTGRLTEFYEPGLAVPAGAIASMQAVVRDELEQADVGALAISGSLPAGAPGDGYARLVAAARERGAATIVDSHGDALEAALAARPTVVKVNAAEVADAVGMPVDGPSSAATAAGRLREAGAGSVVVTLGRDGAVACDEAGCSHLWSTAAAGSYPVGSGDAFLGGLAVALVAGDALVDAATHGMAAGMANARLPGAGVLDLATVDELRSTIQVVRL
jgi:1-phosphofructokinase family hexose kinase